MFGMHKTRKYGLEPKQVNVSDYCETEGEKAGRLIEYYCSGNLVASESFECLCENSACNPNNSISNFSIVVPTNISEKDIENQRYKFAYWQCYDNEEQKQGKENSCKSSDLWKQDANDFCYDHCGIYDDKKSCGVKLFGLSDECHIGLIENESFSSINESENIFGEETLICQDSCPLEGKCYSFGFRKSGNFCSDTGSFIAQTKDNEVCDNSFECSSNICANSKCVSGSLIDAIINWFKKLFGGE